MARGFRRVFRNPFRSAALEREVVEEHEFHLGEKTKALVDQGIPADEARRRAEADFGPRPRWQREALKERRRSVLRARRTWALLAFRVDLALAVRQLLRRPGFTLGTLAVLSVGVGFGVAVLASVDAVLFRPLPFENEDRVVRLGGVLGPNDGTWVSPADWLDWKDMQRSFSAMAATRGASTPLLEAGADYVPTLRVESAFFRVLRVRPALGRLLDADDDRDDAPFVAVLTHRIWSARFGADPKILGREITLGGHEAAVVGVLPRAFEYVDYPTWGGPERDVFLNDVYRGDRTTRGPGGYFWALALLREGVTIDAAQADMDRVADALAEAYPDLIGEGVEGGPLGIRVSGLRRAVLGDLRGRLLLLGGFVALLLLVVCVNVAGLLLARSLGRSREYAVRASFGASPLQLAREALAEVGLLAVVGGATGIGLAGVGLRVVRAYAPPETVLLDHAHVDGRVALGTALLTLAVWLLAGVLPAWRAGRVDPEAILKAGHRGAPTLRSRLGSGIVVAQLTLVTALVTGAVLLLGTYAAMVTADPGFRVGDVRVLEYRLPTERYATPAGTLADHGATFSNEAVAEQLGGTRVYRIGNEAGAFVAEVTRGLRSVPGVLGVAVTNYPPFWGFRSSYAVRHPNPDEHALESEFGGLYFMKWVSRDYFDVLGVPLLRGRTFSEADGPGDPPVMVVNAEFEDTFLRDVDPIGAVVEVAEAGSLPARTRTLVGVVANTMHGASLEVPAIPIAYVPIAQRADLWAQIQAAFPLTSTFLVRVAPNVDVPTSTLRQVITNLDPTLPVRTATTLRELQDELFGETRFWLVLLASFASFGLVLAAAAMFGLLAQNVRQHTRDIGIRRALGASARDSSTRVIRRALEMLAVGLVLGLVASWYLARILAAQVAEVGGLEVGPIALVVGVLLGTSVAATLIPARWAGRVDPMEVLKAE